MNRNFSFWLKVIFEQHSRDVNKNHFSAVENILFIISIYFDSLKYSIQWNATYEYHFYISIKFLLSHYKWNDFDSFKIAHFSNRSNLIDDLLNDARLVPIWFKSMFFAIETSILLLFQILIVAIDCLIRERVMMYNIFFNADVILSEKNMFEHNFSLIQ